MTGQSSPPVTLEDAIETVIGQRPIGIVPLSGGCISDIFRVDFDHGAPIVAKLPQGGGLAIEAVMLRYLNANSELPVPDVLHVDDNMLLLEYVATSGSLTPAAETHAAELLAALHGLSTEKFGFDDNTMIGALTQFNPWSSNWCAFFRDQRLLRMGREALDRGNLVRATFVRLEKLCARLEEFIEEPAAPALIHGDVWGGNVLVRDGRIAAFIDPAIYYANPEIELAFTTLFSTFGPAFFGRYQEIRPIAPGFFETRRDLYNLYPLLVHAALFGGQYPDAVHRIVARYA